MDIPVGSADGGRLLFNASRETLVKAGGISGADSLWALSGESVKRALKERGTERVWLSDASGRKVEAYLKRYGRIPLKQRLKSALSLKFKQFDAFDEWESILAFHRAGLPTMTPLAAADCGEGRSCCLTLGITDYVRASSLLPALAPESPRRLPLVKRMAALAAGMHAAGMAHQDFYLVHIFVKESEADSIYLIDLQRVIRSSSLSRRWIVKDIGQFLHSAEGILSQPELDAFFDEYGRLGGLSGAKLLSLRNDARAKAASIGGRARRRGKP